MQLGCKIQYKLYIESQLYRETVDRFDVWYMDSDVYYNLSKLDYIYSEALDKGKEMYGYYLFSSRFSQPDIKVNINDIWRYTDNLISRYPEITHWELCHEAIDDNGKFRLKNKFREELGKNWETLIYKFIKNKYPNKLFYYSDYIRSYKKAKTVIEFVNNTRAIDGFNFQCHSDIINPLSPRLIRHIYTQIKKPIVSLETVVWITQDRFDFRDRTPKKLLRDIAKKGLTHMMHIRPSISVNLQSYRYNQLKKIAKKYNIETFGIWCVSDNDAFNLYSWQDKPGILDTNFNKKRCYSSIFS